MSLNKNQVPKNFFKKNPLNEISAAKIADFSIMTLHADELNEEINRIVIPKLPSSRQSCIQQEKESILSLETAQDIVAYMRKSVDTVCVTLLCKKALQMQESIMPLILRRYKTVFIDEFIDLSVRIFGNADAKYTRQLLDQYKEIRNPYAQSMACLLFGEHRIEEAVPLLLTEYERFKAQFPNDSYNQCPLLALYILFGKA